MHWGCHPERSEESSEPRAKNRRRVAREPANLTMRAGQADVVEGTTAPLIRTRGGYGQAFPGSFENSQEMPVVASGRGKKEKMPSQSSGKVMPGRVLALPECYVGGNVYADANANEHATATDPQIAPTGAGAMYDMRRPSTASACH